MPNGFIDTFTRRAVAGRNGLDHVLNLPFRFTLHTTEGSTAAGALGAYDSGTGPPHLTTSYDEGVTYQHLSISKGAYALKNVAGGSQSNAVANVQIEIVGFARDSAAMDWRKLVWISNVMLDVAKEAYGLGMISKHFTLRWPEFYDESAGFTLASSTARQRKTVSEWESAEWSVYGHQHVGEGNHHWDPGKLNLAYIAQKFSEKFSAWVATQPAQPDLSTSTPNGPLVAELQDFLSNEGLSLSVDGDYGPETERNVIAWQKSNGVPATGRWSSNDPFSTPVVTPAVVAYPTTPSTTTSNEALAELVKLGTQLDTITKDLAAALETNAALTARLDSLEARFTKLRTI